MIRVENLVKKYGDFTAVNDISFEVTPQRRQSTRRMGYNRKTKTPTGE